MCLLVRCVWMLVGDTSQGAVARLLSVHPSGTRALSPRLVVPVCVSVGCTTAGFPDRSTADFWGQITLLVGSSVSCRTLGAALASTHWTPAAPSPTTLLWPRCGITGLAGGCLTFRFGGLPFHSLSGIFFFFPPLVIVYLAAPGLSCGMRILRCSCEI